MRSRSVALLGLTILGVMLFAGAAGAGISGSKHDFSVFGTSQFSNNYRVQPGSEPIVEVCVFCHTPHAASQDSAKGLNVLLWNRSNSSAITTYTPYNFSTPGTHVSPDNPPRGITLMCMSCHDGITAIQTLINAPGSNTTAESINPLSDQIGDVFPDKLLGVEGPNIGYSVINPTNTVNLSNDHPVSFTWDAVVLNLIQPTGGGVWLTAPSNGRIKLFNNKMECSTCHAVHDDAIAPFLRMSNTGSDMCLVCHIK